MEKVSNAQWSALFDENSHKLAILDTDDDISRLRTRHKLAEYQNSQRLPRHLAAKIQKAQQNKKPAGVKKVAPVASANNITDTNQKLIEGSSSGPSNALTLRIKGQEQEQPRSTLSSFQQAMIQEKPQWHAPWKLMRVMSGHIGWVRCIAVDRDNEWFATGSNDSTIKIWDLASGKLRLTLTGHSLTVRDLAISDRHPYMFSVGDDKMVKCWDLEHNKTMRDYHGHKGGVYAAEVHPTLDLLATAGRDCVVKLWDIRSRTAVQTLDGHRDAIVSLRTQAADPQVVSASLDKTVRLWDIVAAKTRTTLTHHKKGVRTLAMHPDEFTFASASTGSIKQWKFPHGDLLQNFQNVPGTIINSLNVNSDGVLFAGGNDGSLGFYDWKSGHKFQELMTTPVPGSLDSERGILASSFDRTGSRLITCETDKSIKVWREDPRATEESHPGLPWTPTSLSSSNY